jgi:glyoxylase-like metal-dependent hydrolase (beta-lactamase superfamily II)
LIFRETGLVEKGLYVTGLPWSPAYLLAGERPVLFEAGFHPVARFYERDIKSALLDQQPEILFLSHVHYDHCGATAHLKNAFPEMKIAASAEASEIIKRPNALKLMGELSRNVVRLVRGMEGIDSSLLLTEPFEPFEVDVILSEGDVIPLGDRRSVHVLATPGHTRDLFSYYIPEEKILFATESVGVLNQAGNIMAEFLVDYDAYLTSLKRLSALDIHILCQGHHFVFVGKEVRDFLARSIETVERFRDDVERLLKEEKGSIERVVALIKAREYDEKPGPKQPEAAYLLNLKSQVACLAKAK